MKKYDLHVHTCHSKDCLMPVNEVIEEAKKKGLAGIAITDHDEIKGALEAKKKAKGIEVIVGEEIMTDKGEVIGLFLKKGIRSRKFEKVVEEIKKQGGIAVLPHPFDKLRRSSPKTDEKMLKLVDGMEVFNSRTLLGIFNVKAIMVAKKSNLAYVAGSDAHTKEEIGRAFVQTQEKNLKKAILEKKVKIVGEPSPLFVHVRTKILKIRKRFGL